jgi:protein-tyrosine phosphatase
LLVIDLHCHILPGLDDGPSTLDEAVALARAAGAAGITTLVATPHVSRRYPNRGPAIEASTRLMAETLERLGLGVRLRTGGEIALDVLGDLADADLDALRLGGGPYLLLESPLEPHAGDALPLVRSAQQRGFRVVLAHPERSPQFQRDPRELHELAAAGVLMSVTAGAVGGRFGRRAQALAQQMLREGLVHNLSSDMHNLRGRPPGLIDALGADDALAGAVASQLDFYARTMPEAILDGAPFPQAPPPLAARARAWRLRRPGRRR